MSEIRNWRDLLGRLTRDPQEMKRVCQTLGVHPVTVSRWIRGVTRPHQNNLSALMDLFSTNRQFAAFIAREEALHLYSSPEIAKQKEEEIPSDVYAHVLHLFSAGTSHLRTWSICSYIVQRIVQHLDPDQQGLGVTVAQCVPPLPGQKVRSFRATVGLGTGIWQNYLGRRTQFLGAESRVGRAIMTGRPVVVQRAEHQERAFPGHNPPSAESALTYPIMRLNTLGGCLGVFSVHMDFLTPERLNLIGRYAALLMLAYEPDAVYPLQDIDLKVMPPNPQQQPLLAQFRQRVAQRLQQAENTQQILTIMQAETLVWQEIEEELVRMGSGL